MKNHIAEQHDAQEGYCRKLGHHLNFRYCRTENNGKPCAKIMDCWFEKFDIQAYLQQNLSERDMQELMQPKKPKTQTLLDLIARAQSLHKQAK